MSQSGLSAARRTRLRQIFALYDVNHDGYIDENDFVIIHQRLAAARGVPAPAREHLVQAARQRFHAMAEADTDRDGRINEDEFLVHAARTHTGPTLSAPSLELAQATFRAWDADGDGVLNLADSIHAHMAFGLNPRIADLVATFKRFDLDGDGKIQQSEFVEAYTAELVSDSPDVPFMFAAD